MAGKLGLVLGFAFTCAACDTSVDTSPVDGLVTFESLTITRVAPTTPGTWWLTGVLRNHTPYDMGSGDDVKLSAAGASAHFELGSNRPDGRTLVGCLGPNPWEVPAQSQKSIHLRLGLENDPADFSVACEFDASEGWDFFKTRAYQAPRVGSAPPDDFMGNVRVELSAGMRDTPCNPDECPQRARIIGVAPVTAAE